MSEAEGDVLRRYADGAITAEQAADLLGPHVSVAEIVLRTAAAHHRLPDRQDAFSEGEYRRACALLGLGAKAQPSP